MREFRQRHGRSAERFWHVWLEDDFVCSSWGAIVNGKHNIHGNTKDRPGPKGKVDTKGYVSSADNAVFNMDRDIRKKMEEGYIEVGMDGRPLVGGAIQQLGSAVNFDAPLPKNLCFSKPRQKMSEAAVLRLQDNYDLLFTRKVNGMALVAQVMNDKTVHLYSRRMDRMDDFFPHLIDAIKNLCIPGGTVLMFEAFMGAGNTKRDLNLCGQIMRSRFDKALFKQEQLGWMKFYLYRIPFWKGEHLENKYTCGQLVELMENTLADRFITYRDPTPNRAQGQFLFVLESFEGSVAEAMAEAEAGDLEGWVCYQKSAIIGGYSFTFDGKAARPACAFKMKRAETDDFIAYYDPDNSTKARPQGEKGTGRNMGKVGALSLYQLNKNGAEIYIADTSGFTDEIRDQLSGIKSWPICVEVKYDSRFYRSQGDPTNSLDFPRFQRIREDKTCAECINEDL